MSYIENCYEEHIKNPILRSVTRNKIKYLNKVTLQREVDDPPFQIILYLLYAYYAKKTINFYKNSDKAYGNRDVYYRFVKEKCHNWRKLLLLSATEILKDKAIA